VGLVGGIRLLVTNQITYRQGGNMGWWTNAAAAQNFMSSTLPHIIRTVESLSNNIGRLAMATEESNALRKGKLGIGGDTDYLRYLLKEYGEKATVGEVAKQEASKLKKNVNEEEAKQ